MITPSSRPAIPSLEKMTIEAGDKKMIPCSLHYMTKGKKNMASMITERCAGAAWLCFVRACYYAPTNPIGVSSL